MGAKSRWCGRILGPRGLLALSWVLALFTLCYEAWQGRCPHGFTDVPEWQIWSLYCWKACAHATRAIHHLRYQFTMKKNDSEQMIKRDRWEMSSGRSSSAEEGQLRTMVIPKRKAGEACLEAIFLSNLEKWYSVSLAALQSRKSHDMAWSKAALAYAIIGRQVQEFIWSSNHRRMAGGSSRASLVGACSSCTSKKNGQASGSDMRLYASWNAFASFKEHPGSW